MTFNKVILLGNLTRDPELRYTPKGTAIARFSLATNRKWKSESGELKEEVTFVDIDCFGRTAEVISQYTKKGMPLLVEGRLKLNQWEDKESGQKRSKLGVVCESFQFLASTRKPADGQGDGDDGDDRKIDPADIPGANRTSQSTQTNGSTDSVPPEEDDVPF